MKIAGFVADSIVDGPGLRLTIFTQGCKHNCTGCHNPETHAMNGGEDVSLDSIKKRISSAHIIRGITLSGGDPMEQANDCAELARYAHSIGLDVWTYTGYSMEQLLKEYNPNRLRLLQETDVLVDGPFILSQKSLDCIFRGSRNQRILDVKASLIANKPIESTQF